MELLLLAVRRLFAQRSVSAMMIVTFGLTGGVLVASPVYASGAEQAVVGGYLSRANPLTTDLIASNTVPSGFDISAASAQLPKLVGPLPVSKVIFQESSGEVQITAAGGSGLGPIAYRDGVFSEVALADGRVPEAPHEVMAPQLLAADLGIQTGETISLDYTKEAKVVVSGIYSTIGHYDPLLMGQGRLIPPESDPNVNQPLLVTESGFTSITKAFGQTGSFSLEWDVAPDLSGVTLPGLKIMANQESAAADRIGSALGGNVSSDLASLVPGAHSVVVRADAPIYLVSIEVALVCLLVLIGVGSLKLRRQSFELAVMKSRGARTRHLMLLQAAEAMIAAVAGLPVALAIGLLLALVARAAHGPVPQRGAGFGISLGPIAVLAGSVGLIIGALALIALAIPHVRRGILEERRQLSRERGPEWLRSPYEILPLILGAVALAELQRRGIGASGFSLDPLVLVAPTLLLVGGSLLAVRLLFAGFRRVQRWGDRVRSPALYLGLHRLSRSGANVSLALLLVVSAGLFAFAGSLRTTVLTHNGNVAHQQVGGDWQFLVGNPGQPVTAAAALPSNATMIFNGSVTNPSDPDLSQATLMGVDPKTYSNGGWFPSADADEPIQNLLDEMSTPQIGIALPQGMTSLSVDLTAPDPPPPEVEVAAAIGYPNGSVVDAMLGQLRSGSATYEADASGADRLLSLVLLARGLTPFALIKAGSFDVTFSNLALAGSFGTRGVSLSSWQGLQTSLEKVRATVTGETVEEHFTPAGGGPIGGVAPPDPPLPALATSTSSGDSVVTFETGPAHLDAKVVGQIGGFPLAASGEPVLAVPVQGLVERFQQIMQQPSGGTFLVLANGPTDPSSAVRKAGFQSLITSSAAAIEARLASSPQNLALGMEYSAGVAGTALAVLSLGLALYFGGRRRRYELSSLRALGGRPGHAATALGFEYGLVLVPSAAVGYVLGGILLSAVLPYVSPSVAGTGIPHLVIDYGGVAISAIAAVATLIGGLLSAREQMLSPSASMALRGEPE